MTIYITKYALTQGIVEIQSENVADLKTIEGRLYFFDKNRYHHAYSSGEWYTEKENAIQDAEYRKNKKIASLRKQIDKLTNMSFS